MIIRIGLANGDAFAITAGSPDGETDFLFDTTIESFEFNILTLMFYYYTIDGVRHELAVDMAQLSTGPLSDGTSSVGVG